MSKVKSFLFLQFIFFLTLPVLAQVDTGWVRRYNGPVNGRDEATDLAVDGSGNVYVTGYSLIYPDYDYATIKYAPNGDTLWVRRYNGPGNSGDLDLAYALAVDDSGNAYVTGLTDVYCDDYGCYGGNYGTIKYAPKGDTLWVRHYNGPGNSLDEGRALALDDNGNVYVTGFSAVSGTSIEYGTIKYSPNGDTLWVRHYNDPVNGWDWASALVVDVSGNVYVTGYIDTDTSGYYNYDYATIKYAPNGDTLWVRRYNGPGNYDDLARALAVDNSGNVYVTGASYGIGTSYDYATIKYSPAGETLWVRRYNGPGSSSDGVSALALDSSGNLYVSGYSYGIGTSYDYATIKYSPAGETLWVRRYNGPGNSSDVAHALDVDYSGNVYVTGYSYGGVTGYDYATIKYAPDGDTLWVRRYNGPGDSNDYATALAVDGSENVYVTGYSWGSGTNYDYATIKYNKFGCAARAGDVNGDININLDDIILQINYIFKSGPKPDPFCSGDANADGNLLLSDIVYVINFIFKSGPAPVKSKECCL